MVRTFIIVLGDLDNRHYRDMLERIEELGDIRKILDNVYVLNTAEDDDYETIRNKVAGPDLGYCMVISIDGLRAAWNLTESNSKYLTSFFIKEKD